MPFSRCTKGVLSQEVGNVWKYGVFPSQVGLQVSLCSLGQPAHHINFCLNYKEQRVRGTSIYLHLCLPWRTKQHRPFHQDPTVNRAIRERDATLTFWTALEYSIEGVNRKPRLQDVWEYPARQRVVRKIHVCVTFARDP